MKVLLNDSLDKIVPKVIEVNTLEEVLNLMKEIYDNNIILIVPGKDDIRQHGELDLVIEIYNGYRE